jgi:Fe-only nitrogenase accessory protein AnfO
MKIAAYINNKDQVISFRETGHVSLYDNSSGVWLKKKEISLDMKDAATFAEVRVMLKKMTSSLGDCSIFLVGELKGLHRALLEEMGFHTWKSEGTISEQLDNVAAGENERNKNNEKTCGGKALSQDSCGCGSGCSSSRKGNTGFNMENKIIPAPIPAGDINDGYYKINLADILKNDPALNSREILIPFMEKKTFKKLEIFCDHLPKWFSREVDLLNLKVESENPDVSGHGIKVIIASKN